MQTQTETQAAYLQRRRAKAKAFLGGKCARCPTTEGLEFDHVDPSSKSIDISDAIAKHWSWPKLVEELKKCQLLCGDCHEGKTVEERAAQPCGTYWKYRKYGCRCSACKKANSEKIRSWKK
jgi:hypothetical protein